MISATTVGHDALIAPRIYTYDLMGNIIGDTGAIEPSTIEIIENQYNILNQLTEKTVTDEFGELISHAQFTYDRRGNLVKEEDDITEATKTYTYDSTNRMILGTNADGEASAYAYNGLGYLVAQNGTPQVPDYTSGIQRVLQDNNTKFVYGLNMISVATSSAKEYVHTDRLGSAIYGTDGNGNIASHIQYDEWGIPTIIVPGQLAPNYTGHVWDEVLEAYYAKARMYDPVNKRFMAADPIKGSIMTTQSMNAYVYVLNNPLAYYDPLGLFWGEAKDAALGFAAGVADVTISHAGSLVTPVLVVVDVFNYNASTFSGYVCLETIIA